MRLYFIRHGQSENNLLWEETGENRGRSQDPELTPTGHKQAQLLARFIEEKDAAGRADGKMGEPRRDYFGITHLYTSLMVRSVATGAYLAEAIHLPLQAWPEIHECGGIYMDDESSGMPVGQPGFPRSYFEQNFARLVLPESVTEAGWWNRGFETREERPLRAKTVLEALLQRHGGTHDRVAVISHGGFYMEFCRVLFGIQNEMGWFTMNNTAISRFDFRPEGELALIYHNRTDHLPDHLVT